MSFPSSDVVRTATRYYQTVAVATAIKTLRPDLADRVWVPDNGDVVENLVAVELRRPQPPQRIQAVAVNRSHVHPAEARILPVR